MRDGVFIRNGHFYISWKTAGGKRKKRKTHAATLEEAREFRAAELRQEEHIRLYGLDKNKVHVTRKGVNACAMPKRQSWFLYLLKSADLYKIGVSPNPEMRRTRLQCGNPYPIEIVGTWKREKALRDESDLHKMFQHKKIRGEWFSLDSSDVNTIAAHFNA